jgi:hypothetical protein
MAEQVKERRTTRADTPDNSLSPLAAQAQAFAAVINPPRPINRSDNATVMQSDGLRPRPVAPSVTFKVHAVSFYPDHPDRSMALICEPGSPDGIDRWVKKEARIGEWVVQEVRRGMVVVRDGDGRQLREVPLERSRFQITLVKSVNPGSRVSFLRSQEPMPACLGFPFDPPLADARGLRLDPGLMLDREEPNVSR